MSLAPKHGYNALVYVNGTELIGANAWEINIDQVGGSGDYFTFGGTYVKRLAGALDWSGSLTAVHDQDAQILQARAAAQATSTLLLYPDRSDLTTYYNGSVILDFGHSVDRTAVQSQTANFSGADTLTITGFS